MIELLVGDDDYACERYVREQRGKVGMRDVVDLNSAVLDGMTATPEDLAAAAHAVPFLAERRLVVMSRLVTRLSGGGKGGKGKGAKPGQSWEPWIPILRGVPDWTTVLLVEVSPRSDDRRTAPSVPEPVASLLTRREFAVPKGDRLQAWAAQLARDANARFANGVLQQLIEAVGDNTRRLAMEVEKLAVHADGQAITSEDVRTLVPAARDANVFELADAVLERDRFRALSLLHDLLDSGASPQYLLTMLERQLRITLAALDLTQRGIPQHEARRLAGNVHEFTYRKAATQARRYTVEQLVHRIEALCELDAAVKTGALDEELGLDLLVASARRTR